MQRMREVLILVVWAVIAVLNIHWVDALRTTAAEEGSTSRPMDSQIESLASRRLQDFEQRGKFFIYDWPDYIYDVWPPADSTLHPNASYSHSFRGHNGAGQLIDSEIGYFSTWQFSLFQLTMSRLRASVYRTLNPKEAMSFIIPFDIGTHSFIDHIHGKPRVASPHGWRVIEWMRESIAAHGGEDVVWKHFGHDHFVLFSITSYQIIGIGAKVFLTQLCQNCTVLTIETTPTLTCRKYYSNKSRKWWYAVPYPSSFHWHEQIRTLPWAPQATNTRELSITRPYLSIFIGSVETSTPRSNLLRRVAKRDCLEDSLSTQSSLSLSPVVQAQPPPQPSQQCLWFDTMHACQGVLNQTDGMMLYRKTIFCLAPTGDSLTRKSLFDSFVAGCIPVIFAKATISQYLWHIPADVIEDVVIYIPAQSVIDKSIHFLDVLRNVSTDRILQMQQAIARLAPRLQYSVMPEGYGKDEAEAWRYFQLSRTGYPWASQQQHQSKYDHNKNSNKRLHRKRDIAKHVENESNSNNSSSNNNNDNEEEILSEEEANRLAEAKKESGFIYRGTTWSSPFPDAVDVIIDRILTRATVEPLEGFTTEQTLEFARLRDEISAEDPDYVALTRISEVLANREHVRRREQKLKSKTALGA